MGYKTRYKSRTQWSMKDYYGISQIIFERGWWTAANFKKIIESRKQF